MQFEPALIEAVSKGEKTVNVKEMSAIEALHLGIAVKEYQARQAPKKEENLPFNRDKIGAVLLELNEPLFFASPYGVVRFRNGKKNDVESTETDTPVKQT